MSSALYKFETYIPATHLDAVREALFQAGAGRIGRYDRCCWCTSGIGNFRPLAGSKPFLGQCGEDESTEEIKLECVVEQKALNAVMRALKQAHPYETPAFACWRINEGVFE